MKNFLEAAGFTMFLLGLGAGDNESMIIPIAMLITGACLYKIGGKLDV